MPLRTSLALALVLAVAFSIGGVLVYQPGATPDVGDAEPPSPESTATVTAAGASPTPADTTGTETPTPAPAEPYGEAAVRFVDDADGATLATVRVRVADTFVERYTGLSNTESLAMGQGMLFVHAEEGNHSYVMRDMDFPLDMVFVAADGTVTTIHHAPLPPEGTPNRDLTHYSGRAKYVLEVPMGFTNATGVEVGDRLVVPDDV